MQKLQLNTTMLYHGGYCEVRNPSLLSSSNRTKDFGYGFYCTEIKQQAERWSLRNDTPTVNVFTYNANPNLNVKCFEGMTKEWLDFIANCRYSKKHDYDIVIGAMADDQVYNYVSDFIDGILTREQFWVLAKFKRPTNQYLFATKQALECLKFERSYTL